MADNEKQDELAHDRLQELLDDPLRRPRVLVQLGLSRGLTMREQRAEPKPSPVSLPPPQISRSPELSKTLHKDDPPAKGGPHGG